MPIKGEANDEVSNSNYDFTSTQDWFSFNIETWTSLMHRVQSASPRALEIGSWEGRSAVFLLKNLCKAEGEVVCIDHCDLLDTPAGRTRFERLKRNLALTGGRFRVFDEFSVPALMKLLEEEMSAAAPGFDWIYVDGSHEADDTFLDGELAWRLAKKGAIVIFDDYHWDKEPEDSRHHPKRGIDAFLSLHQGEYDKLSTPSQYQMILQKTSDIRIGFLTKRSVHHGLGAALGYGINLALVVDTRYAMAAAVAIHTAVKHTSGRISIYIIDCGLTKKDKQMIAYSISERQDVTLNFLVLLEGSLTDSQGIAWAKWDMVHVLPCERVLYLDADVLVRASLEELWNIEMEGEAIGAAFDVGFPMGHDGVERGAYFNAGVLLMDLSKVRTRTVEFESLARTMKASKFSEQDALNVHFRRWAQLSLKWNAQGLGTYATLPMQLDISDMENPKIVHFTGPVNPSLAEVLNPYVQPYTAKPWGYASTPGHPFLHEWWAALEQTAWRGLRTTIEYQERCKADREAAIQKAVQMLAVKLDHGSES